MTNREIIVATAELAIVQGEVTLRAVGVGSCVVIVFHEPITQLGAMAHAMLPFRIAREHSGEVVSAPRDPKYVDEAIEELVARSEARGVKREALSCRIFGGADMFTMFTTAAGGVGRQNVDAACATLDRLHVPYDASETGGTAGRTIEFRVATGTAIVHMGITTQYS